MVINKKWIYIYIYYIINKLNFIYLFSKLNIIKNQIHKSNIKYKNNINNVRRIRRKFFYC